MGEAFKFVFFYSSEELEIKDVESELFSESRDPFNFFFFHNKDMHFSKSVILRKTLEKMFDSINPDFDFYEGNLIMTKEIKDFNNFEFDKDVDNAFNEYLTRINYRIDCIFQTFSLFVNIYKERNLIFVLPFEIEERFVNYINENNITNTEVNNLSETSKFIDLINRVNYYTGQSVKTGNSKKITDDNIKKIYRVL